MLLNHAQDLITGHVKVRSSDGCYSEKNIWQFSNLYILTLQDKFFPSSFWSTFQIIGTIQNPNFFGGLLVFLPLKIQTSKCLDFKWVWVLGIRNSSPHCIWNLHCYMLPQNSCSTPLPLKRFLLSQNFITPG